MHRLARRTLVVAVIAVSTGAPLGAQAVSVKYSYSGSDYSYNSTNGKTVAACDRETDGNPVRADWTPIGSSSVSSVTNTNGNGTCNNGTSGAVIYKHRIVEVINNSNDDEGPWVYPS